MGNPETKKTPEANRRFLGLGDSVLERQTVKGLSWGIVANTRSALVKVPLKRPFSRLDVVSLRSYRTNRPSPIASGCFPGSDSRLVILVRFTTFPTL